MNKNRTDNAWFRLNAANSVAQLAGLRRNGKLQEAIQTHEAQRVLGVLTPRARGAAMPGTDDEMLAGGDITINRAGSPWPWLAGAAVLIAILMVGTWLFVSRLSGAAQVVVAPPSPTPVVANPQPVNPPPSNGGDYIEFY